MIERDEDFGAETSRFQAFVQRTDEAPPPAWQMGAPASKIGLLIGVIVVVAIIVAVTAWVLGG